jgi:hypothetical protein
MTDFLGNLILRSAADQSQPALLQPRLPSLFEPFGGDEILMPSPDPVVRESVAPIGEPSISVSMINELPTSRATITTEPAEHERAVKPVQGHTAFVPDQTARLPATETQKEVIEPVQLSARDPDRIAQTISLISHVEEPQRTILPHPQGRPTRKELPTTEDYGSLPAKERRKISSTDPLSVDAPKLEMMPTPTTGIKDPIPAVITPLKEAPVLEASTRSIVEPVSSKADSKPAAVLQPIPTVARPARMQPLEQTRAQTPERVVEIYIGRIEVRATPPSAPLKRTPQKATIMSLEEYLRSRPDGKR